MADEEPTLPHTVETDRNALVNTTAAAAALAKLSEALDAAASLQECDSIQKQADALNCDDILRDAVGEELLLGVGTHIGERQDRD